MKSRKLIKLSRREKPKSGLLLCYIRRENVSVTCIILSQNAFVWKDCDMSHCSLCGVPLLKEGNEILPGSRQPGRCLPCLDYLGAEECKPAGGKGDALKMSSISFGDLTTFFGPLDILDPESFSLTTVTIVKERLEKNYAINW